MKIGMAFIAGLAAGLLGAGLVLAPATAEEPAIVVSAPSHRAEIERILEADNLDTGTLGPRTVAEAVARIERGHAPGDFWARYQAHVRAWQALAAAAGDAAAEPDALLAAERAVNSTFDEVERVALRYRARMPVPPR